MKTVTILAMINTMASTVIGPQDVFYQAGVMWNHFHGQSPEPFFRTEVVTSDGAPFRCLSGSRIVPDGSIRDIRDTDLIIVSSILDIDKTIKRQGEVLDWLKSHHRRGVHIATICSGALVLAETGLLDGKSATTHWGFANQFRRRYPKVDLRPERLITDEGTLFCSGGYNAGIDLSLYLVGKYCGAEVAVQSSKMVVSDMGRASQAPYAICHTRKDHGDPQVAGIQEWIEQHYDKRFTYDALAKIHGISRRNLERRFKAATGDTPLAYQQRMRVAAAQRLLEQGADAFDEITYRVGYEDSSSFRKVFLKQTGLRPREYRSKFHLA